jgi:hypothetical protein
MYKYSYDNHKLVSSIATYFEQRNQNHLAGKYFMKAGDHNKAILYLLQTNEPEAIDMAIELVTWLYDHSGKSNASNRLEQSSPSR